MKKYLPYLSFTLLLAILLSACSAPQSSSADSSSSVSESESAVSYSESESSSESSSSIPPSFVKKEFTVKFESLIKEGQPIMELPFFYDEECFFADANVYDPVLSFCSYGCALVTNTEEKGLTFFQEFGYEDIATFDYDIGYSPETLGYFFAHKTIGEYDFVAVSIRALDYKGEWANNLLIGENGNHEGFNARASEAYADLKAYLASTCSDKPLKLWFSGYSRGAAIVNAMASLLIEEGEIEVEQKDMFVYAIETPNPLSLEHALPYENVHNIINDPDIVTHIPPNSYGLSRCGVDHSIYNANVSSILKEFDPEIEMPEFTTVQLGKEELTNDQEFSKCILDSVFANENLSENLSANTRELYVANYQEGMSTIVGYLMSLETDTLSAMLEDIKGRGINALTLFTDSTGKKLASVIKPYLEQGEVPYDNKQLQLGCATLSKAAKSIMMTLLLCFVTETYQGDLTRLLKMHYPETIYVLLANQNR